ncbi:MAG: hypothetical protein JWO86_8404 [Myxococcaceae bacterium]|nr:hypothetical protein [Myxococcaceae bacterium]
MRGDTDISKRALFAALVIHVVVAIALVETRPQERPVAAPAPVETPYEVSIEVPSDPVGPAAAALGSSRALASGARAGARAGAGARASAGASAGAGEGPGAGAGEGPGAGAAPSSSSTTGVTMSLPGTPPHLGLALEGPNTFATRIDSEAPIGPPSPTPSRATQVLRDPSRQRERELGLGPEGPVLRALGDATSASFAPVKGRAVFRAIADRTGMITGIDVVDCDGSRAGWANAAELALEALKGKKLRMPSTATRATMRIEIVSEMKMPSGHDPGVDVSILGVPIAKGEGKQATQVRILDPSSLSAFALAGDPVDIGVKARRVVRSRLLDSEVL